MLIPVKRILIKRSKCLKLSKGIGFVVLWNAVTKVLSCFGKTLSSREHCLLLILSVQMYKLLPTACHLRTAEHKYIWYDTSLFWQFLFQACPHILRPAIQRTRLPGMELCTLFSSIRARLCHSTLTTLFTKLVNLTSTPLFLSKRHQQAFSLAPLCILSMSFEWWWLIVKKWVFLAGWATKQLRLLAFE